MSSCHPSMQPSLPPLPAHGLLTFGVGSLGHAASLHVVAKPVAKVVTKVVAKVIINPGEVGAT